MLHENSSAIFPTYVDHAPRASRELVWNTGFMPEVLKHFDKATVTQWYQDVAPMNAALTPFLAANQQEITDNKFQLPPHLIQEARHVLADQRIPELYPLTRLEAFHGYNVFRAPDGDWIRKAVKDETGNDAAYYGLAFATQFGKPHRHEASPALNYVLSGEGIYIGQPGDEEKFGRSYDGQPLLPGRGFEIPTNMVHGHAVRKGKGPVCFLFVQECGFRPGYPCDGDFKITQHKLDAEKYGHDYE